MTLWQTGILVAFLLGCVSALSAQQSSSTATANPATSAHRPAAKSATPPSEPTTIADSNSPGEGRAIPGPLAPAPAPPPGVINFIPIWTTALAQGDSVIFQQPGTNNIGVNTIAPAGPLDVLGLTAGPHTFRFGSGAALDNNTIRVHNDNSSKFSEIFAQGVSFFPNQRFVPGASQGDGGLAVAPGANILFGDSRVQRMVLSAQGRVGIGFGDPQSPLDVRGTGQGLTGILNVTQTNNAFGVGISVNAGGGGDGINITNANNGIAGTGKFFGLIGFGGPLGAGLFAEASGTNSSGVFAVNPDVSGARFGVAAQASGPSNCCTIEGPISVWGDGTTAVGILGTSSKSTAVLGLSLGHRPTADFRNGSTTPTDLVFDTVGFGVGGGMNFCVIDVMANLFCTGSKHAVVPVDQPARPVAMSAIEAPQNWFEDFGSSQLSSGAAIVRLDPTFAQTINTEKEYHVFLTPRGDCEGLYVAKTGRAEFEVRELRRGTSNVKFDYRIVALRKGYEDARLVDMSEMFKGLSESPVTVGGPITKLAAPAPPAKLEAAPKHEDEKH